MAEDTTAKQWFALRDLSRRNSNRMAYQELHDAGLEVFTPLTEMILTIRGRKQRRKVPVIQDMLFVHATREDLDPYVAANPMLQYRFLRGNKANEPAVVREEEMNRFILAVSNTENPRYYMPGELARSMYGRKVRIIGGVFDRFEGKLLSVKGMRKKCLIVEIPNMIATTVEVNPQYIQII